MRDGAIAEFSVAENLMLIDHGGPGFSSHGFVRRGAVARAASALVEEFRVKTPSIDTPARLLSGGNIQKMVLARELSGRPRVLLAAQPTRGVDIGAAEYIHARLVAERDRGAAVLVISEDLDELLVLADRIGVMFEGRITAVMDRADATRDRLGLLMGGVDA